MADNVFSTYLSLATLKALGTVEPNFPRFGKSLSPKLAVSHSFPQLANCVPSQQSNAEDNKPCTCPRRDLLQLMNVTGRILAIMENEPPNAPSTAALAHHW